MQEIIANSNDIQVFSTAKQYKQQLLSLIASARKRIFITALYLQDDEAGREVLHALYKAKGEQPDLEVNIFVDFHRGQRGLIGEKESLGNRALYLELAKLYPQSLNIYGVAVKHKELFGVLHLKGMVFDDTVFYTGASINDIYLHQAERYRLDRYYQIQSAELATGFCAYLSELFIDSTLAPLLNQSVLPNKKTQKRNIVILKSKLKKSSYELKADFSQAKGGDFVEVQAFIGFGRRKNELHKVIKQLVQNSKLEVLLFTPYFNLPPVLLRTLIKSLKRGVKVTMIVGDKTANDFYIADPDKFSTIGIVPYIYEVLLKRFVKRFQRFIDSGLLDICLWTDANNSFHLKGLVVDKRYHLLTGSNLNPRAWSLDLENGILLDDPSHHLMPKVDIELGEILKNTLRLNHYDDLQGIDDYPEKPKKLLKKIRITQIDHILKQFM